MSMGALVPFEFGQGEEAIQLREACWMDKTPWFLRRSIGEWLGYKHPQESIDAIISRNDHIRAFGRQIKLICDDGREREQEVFDPIGFQLIVMESRQPRAIRYKIAVAHLVRAFVRGELRQVASVHKTRIDLDPEQWNLDEIAEAFRMIENLPTRALAAKKREIEKAFGISKSAQGRYWLCFKRKGRITMGRDDPLEPKRVRKPELPKAGATAEEFRQIAADAAGEHAAIKAHLKSRRRLQREEEAYFRSTEPKA